jgi:hypothetical protein
VRPAEFRNAVAADRRLTQSARRFAEWLSRKRPVPGTDEYPGCQDRAATALGYSLRTIVYAVEELEHTKYLQRVSRGLMPADRANGAARCPWSANCTAVITTGTSPSTR